MPGLNKIFFLSNYTLLQPYWRVTYSGTAPPEMRTKTRDCYITQWSRWRGTSQECCMCTGVGNVMMSLFSLIRITCLWCQKEAQGCMGLTNIHFIRSEASEWQSCKGLCIWGEAPQSIQPEPLTVSILGSYTQTLRTLEPAILQI